MKRLTLLLLLAPFIAHAQRAPLGQAYAVTHAANYDPSISPDGLKMLYISVLMGKEQFFIANLDGTQSVQITRDDANHEDPAWSPDGKRIAFVYMKDGSEIISLMNIDGTGLQHLTPRNQKAIHPHWSPDGKE